MATRQLGTVNLGAKPRLTCIFSQRGTPTDPSPLTTVQFKLVSPVTGTILSYTYGATTDIVHASAGSLFVDVNANEIGYWYGHWEVPNPNAGQTVDYFMFSVDAPPIAAVYP